VQTAVDKRLLEPGETTHLVVHMDTSRFIGVRTVTVYVVFDQPGSDEVRLWVRANSRTDFSLRPDTLAFGHVHRNNTPVASVLLTFHGRGTARIMNVHSESNYIQPTFVEESRQATQVVYRINAELRQDTPVGRWYSDIWVKTNLPTIPQVRIPLTVTIESALSVSPQKVILGTLAIGEERSRRVIVRGIKPFQITGVEGKGQQLSVQDSVARRTPIHVITVRLYARRPGMLDRTLTLQTDLPEDNHIDFRVTATIRDPNPAPARQASPQPGRERQPVPPPPGRPTSLQPPPPPVAQYAPARRYPVQPAPPPQASKAPEPKKKGFLGSRLRRLRKGLFSLVPRRTHR
jgi:hypothetical protein